MFASKEYKENLTKFQTMDGVKAVVLYGIYILILVIQGFTYTTNLSVYVLNKLQILFPLVFLIIGIAFVVCGKEKLCTVGVTKTNLIPSFLWGILLAACFIIGEVVYFQVAGKASVTVVYPVLSTFGIFTISAIQEEIVFRGYIQTRLTGIIKSSLVCSVCTAFLFLLIHYPTRWVVSGFSWNVLGLYYVISLLLLHFVCDLVYRRTNCLWGAIVLHFLYNMGQSMLVV